MRTIRNGFQLALVVALVGCGAKADEQDGSGVGSGEDSSESSVDSATNGIDESLTHGYIKLEFRRGESQAADPFVGTARVLATMQYRTCLTDFYDANPGLRQTGPEGELIFGPRSLGGEGWMDRLCEPTVPAQATCTIESIVQNLDMVKQLSVTYAITGDLENQLLLFGPLPTTETAGCGDPIVRVVGVKGADTAGADLWATESFSPTEAVTNQGGAITIRAARVEN